MAGGQDCSAFEPVSDMSCRVGGIRFDRVTMQETCAIAEAFARQRVHPRYICTGNLDHLRIAELDSEFAEAYDRADLVVADGMPVVWLSKLSSDPLPERVAGSDLVWEIGRLSAECDLRVFLLGGEPGSAASAAAVLERKYPGANIVGYYCPPHDKFETAEEQLRIRTMVRSSRPDILLVAFGAPKQEKWIRKNLLELNVPLTVGVGGSFEMIAGTRKRAPKIVQKIGMEWFWRLAQEPRRLFDRYVVKGIPFFMRVLMSELFVKKKD